VLIISLREQREKRRGEYVLSKKTIKSFQQKDKKVEQSGGKWIIITYFSIFIE
jgi:DNA-binding transcriptional regulator PaaX